MKVTAITITVIGIIIGGVFVLANNNNSRVFLSNANNVSNIDGKQIIEITAKGGYQPQKSFAKAGIPTVIRFKTNGTFDCSSSVRIPSLNIAKSLPQTGSTDIDIGISKTSTLEGLCSMGMYHFEIDFQS